MAVLDPKKAISNLLQKGFIKESSHHHYYEFWHDNKLVARTYSSHNGQELNDFLIASMAKQCGMPKKFFIEFAKCTKSKEDFINLLKEKGDI
ncbi:hypothetical protein [Rufibacter hautae]|uniref:Type II toxin-antitoxin system HicA family toxin n=1 Tax=Rufibacter hautae TaxID=2595005 RepID=A0A5B6TKC2_9BACT|nr:hypothetical protein [Rufibacter hautae]KAA3439900.1 hypothetical protein FOA19_04300 [Rufibacter hautae]